MNDQKVISALRNLTEEAAEQIIQALLDDYEEEALGDYKGRIGVDSEGTTFVVLSADDSEVVIIGSGQVLHASHLSFPLHFDGNVLHQRDCWP
jgi:hypothetical protein